MARSSRSKGSVSVDLFNLPTLPDKRRVATSYLDIPVNFYLPDRKNSKISKIVSRQAFDRQTPDGNEGFIIEIQYLERAFGTNTYLIDKVTGSLFTLHDDHIESTGLCGSECVFDLQELEFHICDLADQRNGEDDSIAEERWSTQAPQHQTPDAPPSPGPPTIPDNFPMYENWENFAHQGESFTISYRQQIYEARSEIITTLIDCFSELNKYTSSHPETELVCHQEKTCHFSYYSWLIQHIDNVLQEDNIFRHSKELPELPAPTYSPSVTDLETIHRIHVMSHAWRESDHALQEATIIHREFMLEQAHMNNTSFSRIRNIDHITNMGYSLNRVSPILREQRTPAQSTNPRNPTSTPRRNVDTLIKILFHRVLTHNMTEGHCHMTLTIQWRTICEVKQLVKTTRHRVHKHLPPIQILLIIKFSFRTLRDEYPVQLVPLANVTTDIHSLPTRDLVRRLPITLIHSLLFQIYLHKPVHIRRAET